MKYKNIELTKDLLDFCVAQEVIYLHLERYGEAPVPRKGVVHKATPAIWDGVVYGMEITDIETYAISYKKAEHITEIPALDKLLNGKLYKLLME